MRKLVKYLIISILLSSCAIGRNDFVCQGKKTGGYCGLPFEKKERKIILSHNIKETDKGNPPKTPYPVYSLPEVRKFYIFDYIVQGKIYIKGHYVYVVVKEGEWIWKR